MRRSVLLLILLAAPAGAESPWHLGRISHRLQNDPDRSYRYAPNADGRGVTIYIIDSGTLRHHQEFARDTGSAVEDQPGNNLVAGPLPERPGVPQEPVDYDDTPASLPRYCPPNQLVTPFFDDLAGGGAVSHGTAVASVAVGRTVGVAPGAKVVPVKVFGCSNDQFRSTNAAAFIAAVEWVAANAVQPAVVSMSNFHFVNGCSNYADRSCLAGVELSLFEEAVHSLTARGIPVVASANNQGTDACTQTPGRLSYRGGLGKVITVGGLAKNSDTRLSTSNFGACVDFWAPAEEIPVAHTSDADDYRPQMSTGTSFAAPIVAGMIARLMSEDPSLHADVDAVYTRLRDSATRVDTDLGLGSPNLVAYIGGVTFQRQPSIACTDATTARLEAQSLGAARFEWYRGRSGDTSTPLSSASTLTCAGETPDAAITRINVPLGDQAWVRAHRSELTGDSADVVSSPLRFLTHPRTHWSTRPETVMLRASISPPAAGSHCTQWLRVNTPVAAPLRHMLYEPGVVELGHFVSTPDNAFYRARAWTAADCTAPIAADFGTFSETAQLRSCNPPSIVREPLPTLLVDLTTRSPRGLEIAVTGSDPVVTWFRGHPGDTSTPLRKPDGSIIRDAVTTPTLGSGTYWAQVGGACGSVDSRPVDVTVCRYSLQGQDVLLGQTVRLVVHPLDANATPLAEPLRYVWTKDGAIVHESADPFYDVPATSRGLFTVSTTLGGCTRNVDFVVNGNAAPRRRRSVS